MYRGKTVLFSLMLAAALLISTPSLFSHETIGSGVKGVELADGHHHGGGHWGGHHGRWNNWDGGHRSYYYGSPYYYYSPGYDYYYYNDPYYYDGGSGLYFRFGF